MCSTCTRQDRSAMSDQRRNVRTLGEEGVSRQVVFLHVLFDGPILLPARGVDLVSTQVPNLDEAMVLLGPGLGDAEREGKVFADMRLYVTEGKPVAAALDAIYDELKLEDLRQV